MTPALAALIVVSGNCVDFNNELVFGHSPVEYFEAAGATFRVDQNRGYTPDTMVVWELPDGHVAVPPEVTVEEGTTGTICIMEYVGL